MEDLLQFGALGLLGGVLYWGINIAFPRMIDSLTTSLDGLSSEVKQFRKTQEEMLKLMALLLAREFGAEKAAKMMESMVDSVDDDRERPPSG